MKITTSSIKKTTFIPFSVTIEFESADEAISLLASLNRSNNDVKQEEFLWTKFVSSLPVFNAVYNELMEQKISPFNIA